jgi:hypothetical protein
MTLFPDRTINGSATPTTPALRGARRIEANATDNPHVAGISI